jgi:hypothetical protein
VPGFEKVTVLLFPWSTVPLSKLFWSSAVAVWGAESSFVHVTVPPALTVTVGGVNANPAIFNLTADVGAAADVDVVAAVAAGAPLEVEPPPPPQPATAGRLADTSRRERGSLHLCAGVMTN